MAISKDREALINKARAALALALNAGATPEEQEQAARTASKLIARYQISDKELAEADESPKTVKIVSFRFNCSNAHLLGKYRLTALYWSAVSPLGGQAIFYYRGRTAKDGVHMRIFIREDLKEVCELLLNLLSMQLETSLAAAAKGDLAEFIREEERYWGSKPTSAERRKHTLTFRQNYIASWGQTVAGRVRNSRKEALELARQEAMAEAYAQGVDGEELFNAGKALVLVEDPKSAEDAMNAWLKEGGLKLHVNRGLRHRLDYDAMATGARDGRKTDVGLVQVG